MNILVMLVTWQLVVIPVGVIGKQGRFLSRQNRNCNWDKLWFFRPERGRGNIFPSRAKYPGSECNFGQNCYHAKIGPLGSYTVYKL